MFLALLCIGFATMCFLVLVSLQQYIYRVCPVVFTQFFTYLSLCSLRDFWVLSFSQGACWSSSLCGVVLVYFGSSSELWSLCPQGRWSWQQVILVCHHNLFPLGWVVFYYQSPSFLSFIFFFWTCHCNLLYHVMILRYALCTVMFILWKNNK